MTTSTHTDTARELRLRLPGIAQKECGGDNLAILLAGYFEPGIEDDEMDDSETWKQGAIDAANRVLDAIHAHYLPALAAAEREGVRRERERCAEVARFYPYTEIFQHHSNDAVACNASQNIADMIEGRLDASPVSCLSEIGEG